MPQLDIGTYYTQSFWLIIIFLIRYVRIGSRYIPRLAYIIKCREDYQEERDWTLTVFGNEIGIYRDILMDFVHLKFGLTKLLERYKRRLEELAEEVNKYYVRLTERSAEALCDKYLIIARLSQRK